MLHNGVQKAKLLGNCHIFVLLTLTFFPSSFILIECIPHTVHFIPVTHLFCNWKFIPLISHFFLSPAHLSSGSHLSVSVTLYVSY